MGAKYDIIVAGGGFSGVCAAISSAREGKRVCLIEKYNCLGGVATFNLVMPFMYYWTHDPKTKERIFLSKGIFEEITEQLRLHNGVNPAWQECFDAEILKYVLMKMARDSGVDLLFQAYITDAIIENGYVKGVVVSNSGEKTTLYADYFIDATGDANLSTLCGYEYMLGRKEDGLCQPMTLSFRLGGVSVCGFDKIRPQIDKLYSEYKSQGKITCPRENLLIFKTTQSDVLHFNTTRVINLNPTSVVDLTKAEIIAREQVFEIYRLLKDNFEPFKNAYILSTGIQIGVRESRRIVGEHILTGDEIKALTRFPDSIATCNYDIDIHNPSGEGTSHYYFKDGDYYTIPYGSLVPKGATNLLACGRCISADTEAQASLRIMPTCATIGQAAGVAVALAHTGNKSVRDIDITKLQYRLTQLGAVLY